MHFQHSYLNFFRENSGAVSDKQGERLYQDIQATEALYWNEEMMGTTVGCYIVMTPLMSAKENLMLNIFDCHVS